MFRYYTRPLSCAIEWGEGLTKMTLSVRLDHSIFMSFKGSDKWGFPTIRDTFMGVPIIRILIFWVYIWGPNM